MAILQCSSLEARLRNSIFERHYKVMDSYIGNNLKKGASNFGIPTVQTLIEGNEELEQELINLYYSKFPRESTEGIDYEIKLLQACALDGLIVGINTEKDGDYQIYTANIGTIFGIDNDSKFNLEKTLELNRKRIVHAVRVDIDYTSEEGFSYKLVTLNKNTNLHIVDLDTFVGRFHIVPYVAIQRSMAFFKDMLNNKKVLKVEQDKGEMNKIRYITDDVNILGKFCDNEEFAKSLKSAFYPLKGFFYAPVIGANSLSSGVTRIDLLNVERVTNATNLSSVITKPVNAISNLVRTSCIYSILNNMYEYDIESYIEFIDNLPSNDILSGAVYDVDKGAPEPKTIISYLNSLDPAERGVVENSIPGLGWEIAQRSEILTKYEKLNISDYTVSDIRNMLNSGVYKFVIQKKDCHYSAITVTNNPNVLKALYGNDYFAKHESLGVRLNRLQSYLEDNPYSEDSTMIEDWLRYCGFSTEESIVDKVQLLWGTGKIGVSLRSELLDLLGTRKSKKTTKRTSYNEELILSRVLPGSLDFYRYIDINKVIAMYRLG